MALFGLAIHLLEKVFRRSRRVDLRGVPPRREGPTGRYPLAVFPIPTGSRLAVVSCGRCGSQSGVSRWDDWNGFFVECPLCGRVLGKSWKLGIILWASLLLNVFSFFFTMRPRAAAGAALMHAAFIVVGGYVVARFEQIDALMVAYIMILLFVPLVWNLFLYMNHEADAEHAAAQPRR